MAEHMQQHIQMGKPLPEAARTSAYKHCKAMGLNAAKAWSCVQEVAEQLERDHPYEAQAAGMKYLDLTGTYRLMAALLAQRAVQP